MGKWPVGWPGEKEKEKWARTKVTVSLSNYSKKIQMGLN
jgi:hypothetical protein